MGITLECLASGLHENHDQTGKRLTQQQGRDDGEHGHQVRGEASRDDAAHVCHTTGAPVTASPALHRNAARRDCPAV